MPESQHKNDTMSPNCLSEKQQPSSEAMPAICSADAKC